MHDHNKKAYLPGLLIYSVKVSFTSSYVKNAKYPGWVTASKFQFCIMLHHGENRRVNTSNSNIDTCSFVTKSIVVFNAKASIFDLIG